MKRLLDSRNRGSQSPPPPIIHTASLAPGGGHIHEPPPPGGVPRPPRELAPPSSPEAHGGPASAKSKLQSLHWIKLNRAVQGTLWEEFERDGEGQSAPPEIDIAELEELFSDVAPEKVDSKEAEKKCPEKVQLIDPSRANAIEIMLTKVKMSLSNMTCAILAMDGEILNVDQLKSILKWIPTREEMAKLKNYNIETDIRMRKCEKYFMELMKVPRMESKVMIFLFKSQFNTQLAKFKKNLKTVNSACQEVQNCNKLKEIVKKILHFGNTINLKSPKGSEVGFKLDTLLKLVNKQALNGKITLMHCLCKVLASKSPDLLDFHEDLVNLEAASKMPTKKLGDEMHVILNGLKKSKHELDTSENDGPISNYFRMRLKEFIGFAEPEVTSVTNFYQVAGRNTYTLALYLGEDPASCPFEQATLTLINFVKLFRKCLEENSTQAEGVTSHGSLALPRGASPPPPPPTGASTQSGEPWPRVGPPSPPPPPPTGPLCVSQPLYERPLGDDPGSGPAKASRPPPPPPVPKVSPPLPAAAWPLSLHPFGGSLGGYPGRGYEPGTPDELPHPPGRLGGGLGRGRRGGGPAVRNSNQKPLHLVTMTRVVKGSLWEEFQLDGERYNTFLNMHPPVPPTPHPPSVYVEPAPPPPPMHEVPRPPPPPPSPGGGKPQLIDGAPPSPPPPPGAPTPPPPGGTLRPPGPPPPPGVPGPPNGPPPPPGRLGPGKACGPAVKKSNLKPLFWFKVTRAVKGSLREEIQKIREGQSSPPEFEISELEAYFSNAPKKVVSKEAEKKKAFSLKPEQVQLIDMRRANNTLTMLTKVKMSYPEIVTAILAMDGTLIDADILENILKCCPTKEEMEQLKNYQGEKELLGKCENYFLELMKVPRMETKLTVLLFKTQFNTQLKKFKKSLNTVNSACDEVRKSIKLSDVIKRILYLPDTLSQGTARGVVAGFNLDSFMELVDTRSSINKMNLMHYLCKVFAAKAPALLDFPEDLVSLEAATKIQLKDLKEMHVIFHDGLQKAKHELDASANDGPISQGFCMGLKEFISFAEAEVTVVTNLYTVARRRANGLALYIGAGLAHCPFEQAIQTLHNFVRLFQKCHEDNQKHEDNENKRKQDGQMTKPYNRLLEVRKASKNMEIKSLVALSHPPPPPGPKNSRSLSPPTLITRTTAPTPPPIHEIPLPPPRASIPGPPRPPPLPGGGTPQLIPGPPPPPGAPTPTPPPPPVGVTKPPGVPGPPPPPSGVPRPPGAPVGPPPPPGQLGKGPVRAPATNMKPLHWFKVTRAVKRSMPEEFQLVKRPPPEFDDKEIETYFSNAAPKKVAPKEAETKKAASSKPEVVQLIDMRRANNMLIMLTEVKMPYPEIVDAILQMDGTLIDADRLENILKFCPTKEEMEQLKNYQGDKNMLGRCEEYFLELMRVPRMESKVNCFLFKTQFNTQLAEFKKSLNIVNAACDEVRKSDKLKGIMKKILYLGNTLNQGTARGSAIGFKLDSLFKLTDTRSSISKITLMHYLCKVLASKASDLLDFHEDLVSLEAATKIQLKTLAEETNSLAIGLKKVKLELDACRNDGEVSEGFHNALESFVGYAEAEVTSVTNFYSVVGRNADALALYFGEDPARCPFEQAIQTLHNFVRLFQKCQKDDVGPIVDERTIVSQEAQDRVTKGAPLKWV